MARDFSSDLLAAHHRAPDAAAGDRWRSRPDADYRNDPEVRRWLIRATVDPTTFREKWLASVEDPDEHSCVALVG